MPPGSSFAVYSPALKLYTGRMRQRISAVGPICCMISSMAYKPMEEIMQHIGPTAEILCRIRPVYNFTAGE